MMDEIFKERIEAVISELGELFENFPTGSRVTCNPPVMNTDRDIIFLVDNNHEKATDIITKHQLYRSIEGGDYEDMDLHFSAWQLHDLNLIICNDQKFFERFRIATKLAKQFNLLKKEDRIALFQSILYQKYDGEVF